MTTPSRNNLTTEQLLELERVCDQFEADFRAKRNREIENYLDTLDAGVQPRALAELQKLASELRTLTVRDDTRSARSTTIEGEPAATALRGDRFAVHERLGVGGAGTVWRAFDRKLERWVALKAPHRESYVDADAFLSEAKTVAKLRHPRIVRVLDAGHDESGCYMISELIEGVCLADRLKTVVYTPREAAALVAEIADGLAYAHKMGVVHRDLKPHNILIDESDNPSVADFGLAQAWLRRGHEHERHAGKIIGTPAYMAPEQVTGDKESFEPRTDVYALGVILFQLLTGELPFRGNVDAVLHQLVHNEPPAPSTLSRYVPIELDTLCLKCLEKNATQRIASAALLRDELRRYVNNQPILSRPSGVWGQLRKFARRNPVASSLCGLAGVLTGLIVTISLASAAIVADGWSREFGLRVEAEVARRDAERASEKAIVARQEAIDAKVQAEASAKQAKEDALFSQQSLQFLESVIVASDPVTWLLDSKLPTVDDAPQLAELLDSAAARIKTELAAQPRVQARLTDTIANSYRGLGRYKEAVALLEQAQLVRTAAQLGSSPNIEAEIVRNKFYRGMIHHEVSEFAKAESVYRETLKQAETLADVDPHLEAEIAFRMGWLMNTQGRREESRQHLERTLAIRIAHCPEGSATIKAARVALELNEASNMRELSFDQLEALVAGDSGANVVAAEYVQMLARRKSGDYEGAATIYGRIVSQLERRLSDRHPLTILAMGEYADLLRAKGDYRAALPLIQKAIARGEAIAPSHKKLKQAREAFGAELMRALRFEEATAHFAKVLEWDAENGSFSEIAHEGFMWSHMVADRNQEAIAEARLLVNMTKDREPFKQAWYHYALARAEERSGNADAARIADATALRIATTTEPPPIPIWLERIATIYGRDNNLEAARSTLEQAVKLERERHPARHPHIADRMNSLVFILEKLERIDEALVLAREILEIRERCLPESDVRTKAARELVERLESRVSR